MYQIPHFGAENLNLGRSRLVTLLGDLNSEECGVGKPALAGVWRDPHPKPSYDVVIVGAGGHGLATAYYLAKEHGIHNVAVIEKGWLGGGNTGRNTTIVRSNYMMPGNTMFYERSMKLWENLSQDLNFNVMISQRGQYNLGDDILDKPVMDSHISIIELEEPANVRNVPAPHARRSRRL